MATASLWPPLEYLHLLRTLVFGLGLPADPGSPPFLKVLSLVTSTKSLNQRKLRSYGISRFQSLGYGGHLWRHYLSTALPSWVRLDCRAVVSIRKVFNQGLILEWFFPQDWKEQGERNSEHPWKTDRGCTWPESYLQKEWEWQPPSMAKSGPCPACGRASAFLFIKEKMTCPVKHGSYFYRVIEVKDCVMSLGLNRNNEPLHSPLPFSLSQAPLTDIRK